MEKQNILGTEKVGRLLVKFSVPGIIALVVNALYNIVDQIFIGQGVGYLGNGATNVIFPLSTLAMAFSLMIGDGTASFMSLMLGKKELRKAAKGTACGLIFTVIAGTALAAVYLVALKPLCLLFGATDSILPYALQYGGIISLGLPFCAVCSGYSSIIRADGSPKYNMVGLLAGCAINLIGDPLFIFVFHWGVAGAALATILGQIANAVINVCYIRRMKSVHIEKEDLKGCLSELPQVLKLGISSFISQMVLVVVMAVQNNLLRTYGAQSVYGADVPISALGVTMKVFSILMVIVIGLASGAQPIWGYNYGARQYERVKQTLKTVIVIGTAVMIVAFAVFQLFPMAIISIFGSADENYNQFAIKTLRIFLLLVPFSAFQLAAGIFFQAVGRPALASIISLSKQIIFSIPALFILCPLVGVEGVLWSGPVSDALAFLLSVLLLALSWKSIFNMAAKEANPATLPDANDSSSLPLGKPRYFINGQPLVISISRTYGAGGRSIGRKLAEDLHIPYYDADIIKEAAAESGLNAMFLASIDEIDSRHDALTPAAYTAYTSPQYMQLTDVQRAAAEAEAAVIEKVVANGSCVIVGRRADQILWNKAPVFSVFVTRPLAERVQHVMERESLTAAEAEKRIKTVDKKREQYYNMTMPGAWGRAENYDLCLDVSVLSEYKSVSLIEAAVQ